MSKQPVDHISSAKRLLIVTSIDRQTTERPKNTTVAYLSTHGFPFSMKHSFMCLPQKQSIEIIKKKQISESVWTHIKYILSTCYTMGCPPVRVDNPREFSEWIILRTGGQTWYNYIIPPTSVKTLHITRYFMLKVVKVV